MERTSSSAVNVFFALNKYGFFLLRISLSLSLFRLDRKSTRLNSSHQLISYAVFCLQKHKTLYFRHTEVVTLKELWQVGKHIGLFYVTIPVAFSLGCAARALRHPILRVFFFNDTATTEIYTLSLHDALPIYCPARDGRQSEWRHRLRGPFGAGADRKSTRLNSSHQIISYAVFCLKKKKK